MTIDQLVPLVMYIVIGFIIICAIGFILKHFIREAIKEAYEEMGIYKKK